jgi:hypothetical protein
MSLIAASLLVACGDSSSSRISKKEGTITSSAAAGSVTDEELEKQLKEIEKEEANRIAKQKASSTTLKFDKKKHDFGEVRPETENKTEFVITNTGDKPLIVEDVATSCGCTKGKEPQGPIAPGESDVIEVIFKSKPGQKGDINKTVTVTANTMDKVYKLEIHAFVLDK